MNKKDEIEPGWFNRAVANAEESMKSWPEWMKEASSVNLDAHGIPSTNEIPDGFFDNLPYSGKLKNYGEPWHILEIEIKKFISKELKKSEKRIVEQVYKKLTESSKKVRKK